MRLILILIVIGAVGYYFWSNRNPLVGEWQSDAALTMSELESANVGARTKQRLANVFGKMRLRITDTEWDSTLNGVTYKGSYQVLSTEDDCFDIEFTSSDAKATKERTTVCIENGYLHIPIQQVEAHEVFRKL